MQTFPETLSQTHPQVMFYQLKAIPQPSQTDTQN